MSQLKLYSYYRSSSAYRVRIALNIKGLEYDYQAVHLLNEGGEQHFDKHRQINPMRQVPCLEHEGKIFNQSMAILLYLEDLRPTPTLFSTLPEKKAHIIEFCEIINSGIQPLQNLAVLQELESRYNISTEEKTNWSQLWIQRGFEAIEKKLKITSGLYCFDDQLSAADAFLIPQVYNAHRFQIDLTPYPNIVKVNENALKLPAVQKARPEVQPDTKPPN